MRIPIVLVSTTPRRRATGHESLREVIAIVREAIERGAPTADTCVALRDDGRPDLRGMRFQVELALRDIFEGVSGAPSMHDLLLILNVMSELMTINANATTWSLADAFAEGP